MCRGGTRRTVLWQEARHGICREAQSDAWQRDAACRGQRRHAGLDVGAKHGKWRGLAIPFASVCQYQGVPPTGGSTNILTRVLTLVRAEAILTAPMGHLHETRFTTLATDPAPPASATPWIRDPPRQPL